MNKAELKRTVTSFRNGILQGQSSFLMCFAVSAPLRSFLELCGVPTKLVEGDVEGNQHFWLEMADGQIIDPTADQFSAYPWCPKGKVYIGALPANYKVEPNL